MTPSPIQIRRAVAADAAAFARTMGHPQVLRNLMQLPYASEAQWQAHLAESLAPGKGHLVLVAEQPDEQGVPRVVANAGLHPAGTHVRRRHVMSLGIAVHPQAQGQGVGRALMRSLCEWADQWGQVLRIELTVFVDNERAIRLYEQQGFVKEGRMTGFALRQGRYVDAYAMARLHPDPPRWDSPPRD
jgi:putative acetyltransferase